VPALLRDQIFSRLKPTRDGVRLLLLLGLIGFAAFNTRNNLLYLMLSLCAASVPAALAAGWLSLRRIELWGGAPSDLYASTVSVENLRLRNGSRWHGSFGLSVEELDFPGSPPHVSLPCVAAGEEVSVVLEKVYPRRGVFVGQRFRLTTGFPFGLFQISREVRLRRQLVVFPPVKRVDISFVFRGQSGPIPRRQRPGGSEELLRIRDYSVGDNLRHVDWKATAKLDRLMVREFGAEQQRKFCIILDSFAPPGPPGQSQGELFETMVSAAASLASHLASHQFAFRFVSADDSFPLGASLEHLRGVLTYLAGVSQRSGEARELMGRARESLRAEEVILLLPGHLRSPLLTLASPALHVINPGVLVLEEVADAV